MSRSAYNLGNYLQKIIFLYFQRGNGFSRLPHMLAYITIEQLNSLPNPTSQFDMNPSLLYFANFILNKNSAECGVSPASPFS